MRSHHAADPDPLRSAAHALPAELLILYESARVLSLPQFELAAVRQLGRLVGFDGGVWGIGGSNRSTGVFEISHATLLDRPSRLLSEYAAVAAFDPVTAAFAQAPHRLQTVDVLRDYKAAGVRPVRDYLQAHDVGQLMLMGVPYCPAGESGAAANAAVSWITAYRAPADRPFGARERDLFQALLPHWQCARRLCAAIHGARDVQEREIHPTPPVHERLSPREHKVLELVARGFTYADSAQRLGLSVTTVYSHARSVYSKLGVHNKTEAVFEAHQLGML